jgi:ADP-ribose pyrophosphatase YjhB (NUDIX family)
MTPHHRRRRPRGPILAAAAIIVDQHSRILLEQRRDNALWGLPGGAVEWGESVTQALHREVREETGLEVRITRLLGIYSDPAIGQLIRFPDGGASHVVAVTFVCDPLPGTPRVSDESLNLGWFEVGNLPTPMMPAHILRIQDWQSGAGQSIVR